MIHALPLGVRSLVWMPSVSPLYVSHLDHAIRVEASDLGVWISILRSRAHEQALDFRRHQCFPSCNAPNLALRLGDDTYHNIRYHRWRSTSDYNSVPFHLNCWVKDSITYCLLDFEAPGLSFHFQTSSRFAPLNPLPYASTDVLLDWNATVYCTRCTRPQCRGIQGWNPRSYSALPFVLR